jgi:hypothetical protein
MITNVMIDDDSDDDTLLATSLSTKTRSNLLSSGDAMAVLEVRSAEGS